MRKSFLVCFLAFFSISSIAYAVGSGGYENATFSAKAIGQANSVVAQADEPAAISYNPAGITQLRGLETQTSLAMINGWTFVDDTQGSSTVSRGTVNLIPLGYMTLNPGKLLGDRVVFGIGSDSPFGLTKQYKSNHEIAKYTGYDNWLKMFTIKPVMAVKVADWLSVGAGPVYYRIFDYGGEQLYPNKAILAGLPDGTVNLKMKGNTWGWQMGILAIPHKKHRFGFYFRSQADMMLKGRADVNNSSFLGDFNTGAYLKSTLPMNMTVGYAFKPTDRTTIETDFGFTRWSVYDRSYINADPTGNAFDDAVLNAIGKTDRDWRNGFSFHLGGNHKFGERWTGMAGFLFYWTPVPKDHFMPAIPDSNRMAFSLGLGYKICKYLDFDIAYEGLINLRRHIDNPISEPIGGSVDGEYSSYIQDVIFTLTYHWDDLFDRQEKKDDSADITTVPSLK
ncbi:MAG: OmpP1/FadL family transporter [Candidatus Omnitrophota bacterium]